MFDLLEDGLRSPTLRSNAIPPSTKILLTMQYLASGTFQLILGDAFGISQASACRCVWETIELLNTFAARFIRFPTSEEDRNSTMQGFYEYAGFPGVVGIIDCTHIKIEAPSENEDAYVNRRGSHSINVQCVTDDKYKFISVSAKWPGGKHDMGILTESAVYTAFENGQLHGRLLGDSGYALLNWLLVPFREILTEAQRRYQQ